MSLEVTAICVVDETGQVVKVARAASHPEALDSFLSNLGVIRRLRNEIPAAPELIGALGLSPRGAHTKSPRSRVAPTCGA